jgi:Phage antirepressor protein KilAC domain
MQLLSNKNLISSLELVEQINLFRKEDGKSDLLHKTMLEIIRDEFEEEISRQEILPSEYKSDRGQTYPKFDLTISQAKQVLVRESKLVRKAVIAFLEKLESQIETIKPKEFTTKELLLLQLETIERAEKAEKTVAILTHVNKTYTSTEISRELGFKSANEMNKKLHDLGVQYKQNDTWILYSKYSGLAYVDIKQEVLDSGKVVYHRRWTQIGREFLINFLSSNLI